MYAFAGVTGGLGGLILIFIVLYANVFILFAIIINHFHSF